MTALGILLLTTEVPSVLFFKRQKYDHGSQATCSNLQERHYYHITETSGYIAENPQIQNQDTTQAWTTPVYAWQVIDAESCIKQKWWDPWHNDKHWYSTYNNELTRMPINTGDTVGSTSRWPSAATEGLHFARMAGKLEWHSTREEAIVAIQWWWVVIDGMPMKGSCIIILKELQWHVYEHLYRNHMGICKTRVLVCESIYLFNMNVDNKNIIKNVPHGLIFSRQSLSRESFITKYLENHQKSLPQTWFLYTTSMTFAF